MRSSRILCTSLTSATLILGALANAQLTLVSPVVENTISSSTLTTPLIDNQYSYSSDANPPATNEYFIGIGFINSTGTGAGAAALEVATDGILLATDQTVAVTSTTASTGVIGMALSGASVGEIQGKLDVSGTLEANGLSLYGTNFSAVGNMTSYISIFSGTIEVNALGGTSTGIDVLNGTVNSILDATITAEGAGVASGITVGENGMVNSISGTTITATNTGANSSSSGIIVDNNASMGNLTNVTITANSTGSVSGTTAIKVGNDASIGNITGSQIDTTSASGSATGIELGTNSTLGSISNTTINVTSNSASAKASGIVIGNGSTFGSLENVTVNVSTQGGQTNLISANIANVLDPSAPMISGDFSMESNNVTSNQDGISVGYIVGSRLYSTTTAIGFNNTSDLEFGKYQSTSAGFNIDWTSTSLSVKRNNGIAAGATVFSSALDAAYQTTTLGAGSSIKAHVEEGLSVGVWINGIDVSGGALLGSLEAYAGHGSTAGLLLTGTDLAIAEQSWGYQALVTQSAKSTSVGDISGSIKATVGTQDVTEGTLSVGVQMGNISAITASGSSLGAPVVFDTTMSGSFSGTISAQIDNTTDLSMFVTAPTKNIVAGIVDLGSAALQFDASAEAGDGTLGTSVSAIMYEQVGEVKNVAALGNAIVNFNNSVKLKSAQADLKDNKGTIRIQGNLIANALGLAASGTGAQAIAFESGIYSVTSTVWSAAEEVNFGTITDAAVPLTATKVYLSDILSVDSGATNTNDVGKTLTINTKEMNFTAVDASTSSTLFTAADMTLNLVGLDTVNIYLGGNLEDYYSPFYFLDARNTDYFDADNTGITYNLYWNGILQEQTVNLEIIHDSTGIYLSIPEPSSATMSILALAGLLARRRRKAV